MSVAIVTFGCRLNAYESEVMRGHAAGLSDTVIVNTCAVTAEAERQARQAIRRAARERPGARIVVTGCAAQIDPAAWARLPGVDRIVGNADKLKPDSWAPDAVGAVSDIMAARETVGHLVTEFAGRARAGRRRMTRYRRPSAPPPGSLPRPGRGPAPPRHRSARCGSARDRTE